MMTVVMMTITGSVTGVFLAVAARAQALMPVDAVLAYVTGGLSGFALAVMMSSLDWSRTEG